MLFRGHNEHPGAGIPDIAGGVLSMLIVAGHELERPAPFVAEQVIVRFRFYGGRRQCGLTVTRERGQTQSHSMLRFLGLECPYLPC